MFWFDFNALFRIPASGDGTQKRTQGVSRPRGEGPGGESVQPARGAGGEAVPVWAENPGAWGWAGEA